MSKAAQQEPKFPWDYEIPNTAFWNSLSLEVGQCFVPCFTASELSQMNLDASLPEQEKLKLLRDILVDTLAQKEKDAAPQQLRDVDYKTWSQVRSSIGGMSGFLGDHSIAEKQMLEELERVGPDGKKDMNCVFALAWIYLNQKRYPEAEAAAWEALPWLRGHEKLGPNSPQALGCYRMLMESVWKQGRYVEARGWIETAENSIDAMEKTDFKKYCDEERTELAAVIKRLEEWRSMRFSKM